MTTAVDTFGSTLRWWRGTRRYSQLQLATEAEVSSRHISFLETGRAKPSREMVVHLSIVLDLPLRDRNTLLHSAGFAPVYSHSDLDAPEMDEVRDVLSLILKAHQPNPAVVVDRRGELVDANEAAFLLVAATVEDGSDALLPSINVNRVALHQNGIRPRTGNWGVLAANLLLRLERELAHRPADAQLEALVAELLDYPDVADLRSEPALPTGPELLVPMEVTTLGGQDLRLITTISTIGAPYDVTLDELRLETFFPSDAATKAHLERGLR